MKYMCSSSFSREKGNCGVNITTAMVVSQHGSSRYGFNFSPYISCYKIIIVFYGGELKSAPILPAKLSHEKVVFPQRTQYMSEETLMCASTAPCCTKRSWANPILSPRRWSGSTIYFRTLHYVPLNHQL